MSSTAKIRVGSARTGRAMARDWWPLASRQGIVGLLLLSIVLAVALLGPLVAPHSISEPIGLPGSGPSSAALLGTDFLGRDVLSRTLHGGLPVLALSLAAIIPTYLIGMSIGLAAGLSRSLLDPALMRLVDLVISVPPLLLLLVLLTGAGTGEGVLVVGIVVVLVPGVVRLVRTATLEVSTSSYVEAAIARGETRVAIARREILPNTAPAVLADLGLRFSAAVTLAASVNFLGLGSKPPAANWGLMIAENRLILSTNVWAVLAPAILLTALAVSVNLLAEAFEHSRRARSRG